MVFRNSVQHLEAAEGKAASFLTLDKVDVDVKIIKFRDIAF